MTFKLYEGQIQEFVWLLFFWYVSVSPYMSIFVSNWIIYCIDPVFLPSNNCLSSTSVVAGNQRLSLTNM